MATVLPKHKFLTTNHPITSMQYNVYVDIAVSNRFVDAVRLVKQSLSCIFPGHQDTVISPFSTISRSLDMSTRRRRSPDILVVWRCCTNELLSVTQLIDGLDVSPNTSFIMDAIRNPASAPSPRASASDANGLFVTL